MHLSFLFFFSSFGSIYLINQLLNYHWETSIFPYLCLGNLQFPLLYLKPTNSSFNVWKIIKYPQSVTFLVKSNGVTMIKNIIQENNTTILNFLLNFFSSL